MDAIRTLSAAGATALIAFTMCAPAGAAECLLLPGFNRAIQARDVEAAKKIEAQIKADSACGPLSTAVVLQRASLEVVLAADAAGRPGGAATRERLLLDADQPDVFWGAADALGDLRFSQRRFAEASGLFERAIEMIKNPSKTPKDPGDEVKKDILNRATEARLLAANEESGSTARYANSTRDFRDGTLGGSFSANVRGFKPTSIPLPINFETGTDKPTAIGVKAEEELLTAIREQHPAEVLIVGHTDERGADDYNMRLSEARARAVAKFLESNGVTARIRTLARGKREPFKIDDKDTTGLSKPDIWALNRRVEWRRP
jgi:outer membrane protein OmpA-like peptidoglycan-associated protein